MDNGAVETLHICRSLSGSVPSRQDYSGGGGSQTHGLPVCCISRVTQLDDATSAIPSVYLEDGLAVSFSGWYITPHLFQAFISAM